MRALALLRSIFLLRRRDGTAAIEFAIIAPVMIMMIFAIIEFGMVLFIQSTMEAATNLTARLGKTGYAANGLTQQQTILNQLYAGTAGLLDPKKISVTSTSYATLTQVSQGSTPGTEGLGMPSQIVVYTVSYPWQIMTPMISSFFGNNGVITISSRTVVKNEPYGN